MSSLKHEWKTPLSTLCVASVFWGLSGAAMADPCEPLRQRIESQIVAKGITDFSITVVAIGAEVEGKVVGWCDTGQRKVVYRRGAPADPRRVSVQLPAVQPRNKPAQPITIITECRDGSVITHGDCPG